METSVLISLATLITIIVNVLKPYIKIDIKALLLALGIFLSGAYWYATDGISVDSLIEIMLAVLSSVGLYEMSKSNLTKNNE